MIYNESGAMDMRSRTQSERDSSRSVNGAQFIFPDWPAPTWVRACTTTRVGGASAPPYATFNLAHHVGDALAVVAANRKHLAEALNLPAPPVWLDQIHSARAVDVCHVEGGADAAYTDRPDQVCAVLTADCLPILLCDRAGSRVAAVHAGWRGLAAGVIENTLHAMPRPATEWMAWLGPAIGPEAFEVGDAVREVFIGYDGVATSAFRPHRPGHWLADIYELARQRLRANGVTQIYGGGWCTVRDAARFYSYRREGVTGRMASLIWIASPDKV